jgi:hypothetical protein
MSGTVVRQLHLLGDERNDTIKDENGVKIWIVSMENLIIINVKCNYFLFL